MNDNLFVPLHLYYIMQMITSSNNTHVILYDTELFTEKNLNTIFTLSIQTTPYHACPKLDTSPVYYVLMCLKTVWWVANSVDPDLTHSMVSDLG